jgi:hypothetical protein
LALGHARRLIAGYRSTRTLRITRGLGKVAQLLVIFCVLPEALQSLRVANARQSTLPNDTEPFVIGIDHVHPPAGAQRPKAFAKKSLSTASSPILA